MSSPLDDHLPENKELQPDYVLEETGDPEYMHLDDGTPQEEFDRMWQEGDTITTDGYLRSEND